MDNTVLSLKSHDMNGSTKTVCDLIYLVTCAVNEYTPDADFCREMDLEAVYRLAQFHFLSSAAAYALEKVMELPRAFDQAKKKAIHKLSLFDIERVKILAALEQKGVWYMPLKGILLQSCYPNAMMREMNDNDILFDREKSDVVKAVMDSLGYTCVSYDMFNHDVYEKPPTMEFEMHRALFDSEQYPEFAAYFDHIGERMIKDSGNKCGYHLSDEDFYLYMICHMNKHYINGGTGLRSLADVYLFNKARYDGMDQAYLSRELDALALTEFEQKVREMAKKLFCGEEFDVAESEETMYFVRSGANGTSAHWKENNLFRSMGGEDTVKAKQKYLLKRVFISGDELKKQYPTVYKHKILYPVLLVYRPIKGAITHPKGLINEVKDVKKFKIRNK